MLQPNPTQLKEINMSGFALLRLCAVGAILWAIIISTTAVVVQLLNGALS